MGLSGERETSGVQDEFAANKPSACTVGVSGNDHVGNWFCTRVRDASNSFQKACRQFWKHAPVANDQRKYPWSRCHAAQHCEG
jgi:hypothetical protein